MAADASFLGEPGTTPRQQEPWPRELGVRLSWRRAGLENACEEVDLSLDGGADLLVLLIRRSLVRGGRQRL